MNRYPLLSIILFMSLIYGNKFQVLSGDIMGYEDDQLVGHRYDRADLIHPDELKRVWHIQEKLKETESIAESRYCTIQRWKHGQTGDYIMLSMVWDVNVTENKAIVICKPIDRFISGEEELN